MGKATGFLEYIREENPAEKIQVRISGFREFHIGLEEKKRREQGGRCMNCGVPFCQSVFGCPLHNLIPEWNDEIFSGNWKPWASRRLRNRPKSSKGRNRSRQCRHHQHRRHNQSRHNQRRRRSSRRQRRRRHCRQCRSIHKSRSRHRNLRDIIRAITSEEAERNTQQKN